MKLFIPLIKLGVYRQVIIRRAKRFTPYLEKDYPGLYPQFNLKEKNVSIHTTNC